MNIDATETKFNAFLKGFASAFDISGQTWGDLPDPSTGFQRDGEALRSDWLRIGSDMESAMYQVVHER